MVCSKWATISFPQHYYKGISRFPKGMVAMNAVIMVKIKSVETSVCY